jgi:hypothetical protein
VKQKRAKLRGGCNKILPGCLWAPCLACLPACLPAIPAANFASNLVPHLNIAPPLPSPSSLLFCHFAALLSLSLSLSLCLLLCVAVFLSHTLCCGAVSFTVSPGGIHVVVVVAGGGLYLCTCLAFV